jgi:hypothetical protein
MARLQRRVERRHRLVRAAHQQGERAMAASALDNGVLERVKILEVAGVFRRRDLLDATADALLLSGFDRADIDMVAGRDARERFGVHVPVEELPDVPGAPRRPLIVREDLIEVLALVLGILIFFGAAAAAAVVISSGGSPLWTGAAAVVGAGAAGGVSVLIARALGRRHARELEAQTADSDLVLCVRVRSPEDEMKAQQILLGHGAEAVRPHEIEIDKRLEDLPLHSLRADPWLGDEPLARP